MTFKKQYILYHMIRAQPLSTTASVCHSPALQKQTACVCTVWNCIILSSLFFYWTFIVASNLPNTQICFPTTSCNTHLGRLDLVEAVRWQPFRTECNAASCHQIIENASLENASSPSTIFRLKASNWRHLPELSRLIIKCVSNKAMPM